MVRTQASHFNYYQRYFLTIKYVLRAKQEVDVLFCLVPEDVGLRGRRGPAGAGREFATSVPVHVLRYVLPAPEQADAAHPLTQPRVAQVPRAAAPPPGDGRAGRTPASHGVALQRTAASRAARDTGRPAGPAAHGDGPRVRFGDR